MITGDELLDWIKEEINEATMVLNHSLITEDQRVYWVNRKKELLEIVKDYD